MQDRSGGLLHFPFALSGSPTASAVPWVLWSITLNQKSSPFLGPAGFLQVEGKVDLDLSSTEAVPSQDRPFPNPAERLAYCFEGGFGSCWWGLSSTTPCSALRPQTLPTSPAPRHCFPGSFSILISCTLSIFESSSAWRGIFFYFFFLLSLSYPSCYHQLSDMGVLLE